MKGTIRVNNTVPTKPAWAETYKHFYRAAFGTEPPARKVRIFTEARKSMRSRVLNRLMDIRAAKLTAREA